MSSWHTYPSIYNLGHRALGELLLDEVLIEEKVDGSQISFGLIDGELKIRSKGADIYPQAPEKMFKAAVETIQTLPLEPGFTYRGEYLAKPHHNALMYDRVPKGHIILFDINTDEEAYLPWDQKALEASRLGLEVVPAMYLGKLDREETLREYLNCHSVLGNVKYGRAKTLSLAMSSNPSSTNIILRLDGSRASSICVSWANLKTALETLDAFSLKYPMTSRKNVRMTLRLRSLSGRGLRSSEE